MNFKEVYINGILLDIEEKDNPIQLTYAVNDLAELKDRQAYSTNTFKIPHTANNDFACGLPGDPNLIQLQPYRRNTARILQNGIEVLQNGIAIIRSSAGSIEIQILSGLIGFFDLLGDKSISDLDLSAYDHVWNINTVSASQSNTEGFIYPVIDYGFMSETLREADARRLRPAVFRKTIIERIIAEAGYTATGSYSAYSKYLNSIIPFTKDKFEHGQSYIDEQSQKSAAANKTIQQILSSGDTSRHVLFQDKNNTTDPGNHWNGSIYTATGVSRLNVKINYDIRITDIFKGGSTPEIYIWVQTNNGGGWVNRAEIKHTTEGDYKTSTYLNQVLEAQIDILNGEQMRIGWDVAPAINRAYVDMSAGAKITIENVPTDVIYGQEVQLSSTLPEISQKNFFKDFLQNFGLIAIPDNYSKKLLLINMEDVYANKNKAYEIPDSKLVNSPEAVTFTLPNYGINNNAVYKEDNAVPGDLGKGTIVLDNLTLEQNIDLFESIFAATVKAVKLGGLNVSQIIKIEDEATGDFKTKTEPRILIDQKVNSAFDFFDGASRTSVTVISLPLFDGLDYQTLFEENYAEIKRMLYRPYIVTKQILLKEIDIQQITDWTVPVYDKKTASYYYKNLINYLQGDISTISLIRLP